MRNFIALSIILLCCSPKKEIRIGMDIQGHRGARGLAPENSLPAFIMAAELGVTTLELDLVVSKDNQLVVSHEPFFSSVFCLDTYGNPIPEDSVINMYELTYEEIKQFDCGSIQNPRFPEQKQINTIKPLLSDVIDSVESYSKGKNLSPLRYNIELKTKKQTDAIFHPSPEIFSDLVFDLVKKKGILNRITIQSFDFRTLQYFKKEYPHVQLALLIENEQSWKTNIDSLGFKPEIYSPYYQLLSQEIVKEIQGTGMKVIPWTVNDFDELNKVLAWEVDGIITDYPDRALTLTKKK